MDRTASTARPARLRHALRTCVTLSTTFALCGCQIMSHGGPSTSRIVSTGTAHGDEAPAFQVVEFSDAVADVLSRSSIPSLKASFGSEPPPPRLVLNSGDVLDIAIFESAPGGLFAPAVDGAMSGSHVEALPKQIIDQNGFIDVPYGGRIRAAGRTPEELGNAIEIALRGRAIEPQVLVSAIDTTANTATVLGDVTRTGRIKLSVGGDRLLTVLANAGIRGSETETVVRLVRQGSVQTVPLTAMVNTPAENVYAYPGDTIIVLNEPQVFNVLGAVNKPGQYPIRFSTQSVAGAVSLAGGLVDEAADAGGVFLFRFVPADTARQLLPGGAIPAETAAGVPMVFRIRFSDPRSFFWLQQAHIRNSDMIYVATSVAVELAKFVALASQASLVGLRAAQTRNALQK
jgi:polysaccharide export outer membrane protein